MTAKELTIQISILMLFACVSAVFALVTDETNIILSRLFMIVSILQAGTAFKYVPDLQEEFNND